MCVCDHVGSISDHVHHLKLSNSNVLIIDNMLMDLGRKYLLAGLFWIFVIDNPDVFRGPDAHMYVQDTL